MFSVKIKSKFKQDYRKKYVCQEKTFFKTFYVHLVTVSF